MNLFSRLSRKSKKNSEAPQMVGDAPDWLFDAYGDQTAGLLLRVEEAMGRRPQRLVQFIAAGPDEGTSSVAWAYARASSKMLQRRVLLMTDTVDTDSVASADRAANVDNGLVVAMLQPPSSGDGRALPDVLNNAYWHQLREQYDEVVIDSPSSAESSVGRFIASHADAVVIVVEAEKTRAPVARQLVDDLNSVHANIIGSVLNKRKFYVPAAIYNRL